MVGINRDMFRAYILVAIDRSLWILLDNKSYIYQWIFFFPSLEITNY